MENGYIESFHGKFREECLNEHWFLTLDDARETIESWRIDSNHVRPHSALGYLTPEEFAMGHANVESKERFPHLHSPGCCGLNLQLDLNSSTLTCPD
jgi:putative transposase